MDTVIVNKSPVVAQQLLWVRRGVSTTPMHLIKLIYICHGWMLGLHDDVLLYEPVEAWRYGPVVPSVYHRYKTFRAAPIDIRAVDQDGRLSTQECALIDFVNDSYSDLDALQLSSLTHEPGTPWHKTVRAHGVGAIIPNALIKEYYKEFFHEVSG